jgi:hypothetical protein
MTGQTDLNLMTPLEIADAMKLEVKGRAKRIRAVYELTRSRARRPLPVIKIGRLIRFDRAAVQAWLAEGMRNPPLNASRPPSNSTT